MSKPQNLLDTFRSHSYHHILIVCDGTQTAEKLATTKDITKFQHESAGARLCAQEVEGGGRYVVLIDGTADTHFSITSAKWTTVFQPQDQSLGGTTNIRTLATDGELIIKEHFGVNFMNVVTTSIKSFGADPLGVAYVLKTIFVGHTHSGETETIANVRPLLFAMADINATFDATGAEYTVGFTGAVNGVTRLPQFTSIGDGYSMSSKTGENIGQLIGRLQEQMQADYDKRKTEALAEFDNSDNIQDEWVNVKYKFEVDPIYAAHPAGTATPASGQTEGSGDATFSATNGSSIESLLDQIMRSSKELLEDDQKDPENQFIYKITSTLDTSPDEYFVRYYVHRMKSAIKTPKQAEEFNKTGPVDPELGIEFDYIFTGNNVDVLDFDIEMNMGLAFFTTLLASPNAATNARDLITHYNRSDTTRGTGLRDGSGDPIPKPDTCMGTERITKKPFFVGKQNKDTSSRNSRVPQSSSSYEALLTRHAALENIQCTLKIRGNPQILEETTQVPSSLKFDAEPAQTIGAEDARPIMPSPHTLPSYVKVNVMMPREFNATSYSNDYAEPFWYKDWYFVLEIEHEFSDGEFTQELKLLSVPINDVQYDGESPPVEDEVEEEPEEEDEDQPWYSRFFGDDDEEEEEPASAAPAPAEPEEDDDDDDTPSWWSSFFGKKPISPEEEKAEATPTVNTNAPTEEISISSLDAQRGARTKKHFKGGSSTN